jgi:N-acyl-D-amino-acid deacylase
MYDLVIRGATVVDGLGHDPFLADLAVQDGRIAQVGPVSANAIEVVDAGGLALMRGLSTSIPTMTRRSPGTGPCRPRPR